MVTAVGSASFAVCACANFNSNNRAKKINTEITMSYENCLKLTDEIVSGFDTVVSENEHLWEVGNGVQLVAV